MIKWELTVVGNNLDTLILPNTDTSMENREYRTTANKRRSYSRVGCTEIDTNSTVKHVFHFEFLEKVGERKGKEGMW